MYRRGIPYEALINDKRLVPDEPPNDERICPCRMLLFLVLNAKHAQLVCAEQRIHFPGSGTCCRDPQQPLQASSRRLIFLCVFDCPCFSFVFSDSVGKCAVIKGNQPSLDATIRSAAPCYLKQYVEQSLPTKHIIKPRSSTSYSIIHIDLRRIPTTYYYL